MKKKTFSIILSAVTLFVFNVEYSAQEDNRHQELFNNTYFLQYRDKSNGINRFLTYCPDNLIEKKPLKSVPLSRIDDYKNDVWRFFKFEKGNRNQDGNDDYNIIPIMQNNYILTLDADGFPCYSTTQLNFYQCKIEIVAIKTINSFIFIKSDIFFKKNNENYYLTLENNSNDFNITTSTNKVGEWLFIPRYPSAGYSNFHFIIRDFNQVMRESKADTDGDVGYDMYASSNHDRCGLTFETLESPTVEPFTWTKRFIPIFTSQEKFEYDGVSEFVVTRGIKVKDAFSCTIENGLSDLRGEETGREFSESHLATDRKANSRNTQKQRSNHTKLQTQLNFSIDKEEIRGVAKTNAKEDQKSKGKSATQTHNETNTSKSHDQWSAHTSAKAKGNLPFASVSVEAGGSYTSGSAKEGSKSEVKAETEHHDEANKKIFSETNNKEEKERKSTSRVNFDESGKQHMDTSGATEEAENVFTQQNNQSILSKQTLTRTVSINEVTTKYREKEQEWHFSRRIWQTAHKNFSMNVYENRAEFENVGFTVPINISGCVRFTVTSMTRRDRLSRITKEWDFSDRDAYYVLPSTIISLLPAPGFKGKENGTLDYIIKGKVGMQHPIDIVTEILPIDHVELPIQGIIASDIAATEQDE